MGKAIRCITRDGAAVAVALDATDIVARAEQIHQTSAVVTAALGRTLAAASIMGLMLKGKEDSVTLRIDGGGPAGRILAVSDNGGNVRGYASNPVVEIPLRSDGKLDVGSAVGRDGLLYVLRDAGGSEPYTGCIPLINGEIAEDLTRYYAQSEQIPTVCALGVLVNPDLTVKAAGGLLLQLLPFCPDDVLAQVERNAQSLPPVSAMLESGMTPEEICARALEGMEYDVLDIAQPQYRCACSREKVEQAFAAMRPEELRTLPDEQGRVEATCSFCDAVYTFTAAEIEKIAERCSR